MMTPRPRFVLKARGKILVLGEKTALMGIINLTPDSFSGDGRLKGSAWIRKTMTAARQMIKAGAAVIDVGGESTRPGAGDVAVGEELRRVLPVIRGLAKDDVLLSVDTSKPEVARAAVAAGAHIVNSIQGTPLPDTMMEVVRRSRAGIVLMHMRGTPRSMQTLTQYRNVVRDVTGELKKSVEKCLGAGIKKERILVDPGIGFAKTAEQNLLLLRDLDALKGAGCPVLIGPSRKSFIGKVLGEAAPQERLWGTAAAIAVGIMNGAHMVRVHDVPEMNQVARVTDALLTRKK